PHPLRAIRPTPSPGIPMNRATLVRRSLTHYWRTHLAVVLGIATAVAVLSGALITGDSVRGSLRALVLQRLGRTDLAVVSTGFVREVLVDDIRSDAEFTRAFSGIAPLLITRGFVSVQGDAGRAGNAAVYGVDERFFAFHGLMRENFTGQTA